MKVSSELVEIPFHFVTLISIPLSTLIKGMFGEWYELGRQLLTLAACLGGVGWKMLVVKPWLELLW